MAVTVLDTATGVQGSTNNPLVPSAGAGERYWIIAIMREGAWTNIPTAITVTGTTDSNLDQIASVSGATFKTVFYGAKEADIGTGQDTGNGSITYDDGDSVSGSNTVIGTIVLDGVDQTTPYTNTEDDGWSVDSTNGTEDCPFTLDEIEDGLGVAFVACSKTGTTWDLTDNGYAANGDGQWVQGTNTSANCATKSITTTSLGQLTTLASGLDRDKTSTLAVMLLPAGSGGSTNINVELGTVALSPKSPFVLASNIASLINTVDNYVAQGSVGNFAAGGSNTSDATYRDETDELVTIRNGGATADVYDLGSYGTVVKTITLNFDGSDCEGICDMGGGEFATCSEDGGRYQVNIYDWPSDVGTTANSKQELTLAAPGTDNNSGAEGVCYDRKNKIFYVVGEGEQSSTDREFFKVLRPGVEGRSGDTSTSYAYNDADDGDGWSFDDYVTQPWDPEVEFASYGATGAVFDLSSVDFDHASDNVVITSDTGQKALQVDVTDGSVVAEIDITSLSQMEGVAILPDGEIMFMGEADEYQIYESVLNISASTDTIALATFSATVQVSTPTNVSATLDSISLTEFSTAVEALVNLEVTATLDTISLADFNATVEALTNTNVTATLDTISLASSVATVEALTNTSISATLDTISLAGISPVVQFGEDVNFTTTLGTVSISPLAATVQALVSLEVSATVDNVSLQGYSTSIGTGDLIVSATVDGISVSPLSATVTGTNPLPSFLGSGVLMYSLNESYFELD